MSPAGRLPRPRRVADPLVGHRAWPSPSTVRGEGTRQARFARRRTWPARPWPSPAAAGGPSWICGQLIKGGDEGDGARVASESCPSVSVEEPDRVARLAGGCVCRVDEFSLTRVLVSAGKPESAGHPDAVCLEPRPDRHLGTERVGADEDIGRHERGVRARPGDDDSGSLAAGLESPRLESPGPWAPVGYRGWTCALLPSSAGCPSSCTEPHHGRLGVPASRTRRRSVALDLAAEDQGTCCSRI